uniref:NPH3 domain-containing protein n=1 Tax=Oryza glumipatula TaxID=40148 RepID=A0A0E0BV53_9ORYZ
MGSMKLSSKPDAFTRRGQAWYCTTGLPSDVLVEVGEMSFHLHKFPLLSKSAILGRLIEENSDSDECVIKLSDIPGGAKSFELVARFCYGLKIELSSENVVYLRCAAEHLEMTEETSGDNLINQTESFFNQVVLRSWKDSLEALRTCDGLLPHAEDLHIVKRCIESLAGKASIDPDLFGWPVSEHSTMQSPGGSVLWNGISTGAKVRNWSSDWWYDDASSLSFPTYKRLISSMESRGIKQEIIAGSLTYCAKKFLPGLNRRQSTGPMPLPAATLSDEEQRRLLEEIDRMLPLQRGLISTNVLLWLLRTAMILKVDRACISNLEKRVGMQLDEATLEDLLLPNFSYTMDTLYNVECIHRILDHFLAMDQTMGGGGASPCLDDVMASPSLAPITAVAKLIDGYLAEIAPDINLKPLKFQSLAAALPEYARPLDDGLYRAIDVYLKSHPTLPEAEREQLCRLIDCQKLSLEACTHAAQNERLPLRVVVQVLFFEQLQLRTSVAGCLLVSDNLEASSRTLRGGGGGAVAASGEAGCWATAAVRENQALRVGMDSMRLRLMELERECSDMRQDIRKLGRGRRRLRGGGGVVAGGKDGGGWAARVQRMLTPRMMKLQMCSAQHDAAEQQRMNNEHKKVEKVAKNKKQLSMDDGDDEEEA